MEMFINLSNSAISHGSASPVGTGFSFEDSGLITNEIRCFL